MPSPAYKKIEENFERLKKNRDSICERLSQAQFFKIEIENRSKNAVNADWEELYASGLEAAQSTNQLILDYLHDFDQEIERVSKVLTDLKETDQEKLREAFEEFVLTDTSFSAKNFAMMLYDFDRLIESMRDFSEEPPNPGT